MKVEVSVECLPRVSQDRKDNWYVVVVFGNDEGEPPWNKKLAQAAMREIEERVRQRVTERVSH